MRTRNPRRRSPSKQSRWSLFGQTSQSQGLRRRPLTVEALEDRRMMAWIPEGPRPTFGGPVLVPPNNDVAGGIHAIAVQPGSSTNVYVGAVNGGIWRTSDAGASWVSLTDRLQSQSIGDVRFDPTDTTFRTLVAGTGRYSNYGDLGGATVQPGDDEVGVYRTTNGGVSWTVLNDGNLTGKTISAVVARGATILAATAEPDQLAPDRSDGLWRSTNSGAAWTKISDGTANRLPLNSDVHDLAEDSGDQNLIYAGVSGLNGSGLYRSTDAGATWTNITANINSGISFGVQFRIAVHRSGNTNVVYVAVIGTGRQLVGVWQSTNASSGTPTWTQMDTPVIHFGGQGNINTSLVAHPTDPNLVFIAGDRTALTPFNGIVFRGDRSVARGSQFTSIVNAGAGNTAPHTHSHEMAFLANGNLLQADDGGIYRHSNPTGAGVWNSFNGTLEVMEVHDAAWNAITNTMFIGTHANGNQQQPTDTSGTWNWVSNVAGGDVAVDSTTLAATNRAYRYYSAGNVVTRQEVDNANAVINTTPITVPGIGAGQLVVTPIELNAINPTRMLVGGPASLAESTNINSATPTFTSITGGGANLNAMVYGGSSGGTPNPDLIYVGSFNRVLRRTTAGGALTATTALPTTAGTITDVAIDPDEWNTVFAIDDNQVFMSTNAGNTWSDITGNLATVSSGLDFRTIEYIPGATRDGLLIGTRAGVFVTLNSAFGQWGLLDIGMPDVPVYDLEYNAADNIVVAATLGRGAWSLPGVRDIIDGVSSSVATGIVFNDANGDAVRQPSEAGIVGATVYIDANNNSVFDAGETNVVSGTGGAYSLNLPTSGTVTIRQVLTNGFTQTLPANNGGYTIVIGAGGTFPDRDFGSIAAATSTTVSGIVFNDANSDGVRQGSEAGVGGVVVYIDANGNRIFDAGETNTLTSTTGAYSLSAGGTSSITVRQVLGAGAVQTFPANNGGHTVNGGGNFTNRDFGVKNPVIATGEIHGFKWDDQDGDGIRDPNEPGVAGVLIYVDLNNNGRIGIGEPAAYTDANGNFTIKSVRPGTYTVRENITPGQTPTSPAGGVFTDVVVKANEITVIGGFGNTANRDYGDAPDTLNGLPTSYFTTGANAASHGILAGFGLGDVVDAEPAGQPSAGADGDDNAPVPVPPTDPTLPTPPLVDDEDGVTVFGLTPGNPTGQANVKIRTNGLSPGYLQAWADFNGDGDWNDAGERIITDRQLAGSATPYTIPFPITGLNPSLGSVVMRFRYGYETGAAATPSGAAGPGEVEDHLVPVLGNTPVARPDAFPVPPDFILVKSVDNPLDGVLINDSGAFINGQQYSPQIVGTDFLTPVTTSQGGTVRLNATGDGFIYDAPQVPINGPDTFQYRVQVVTPTGTIMSNFTTVSVTVIAPDPVTADDTFTVTPGAGPFTLDVLANDYLPVPRGSGEVITFTQPSSTPAPGTGFVALGPNGNLVYTPPSPTFRGTAFFTYTVTYTTPDPITGQPRVPSTSQVAVQVSGVPGVQPSDPTSPYLALISANVTDATGAPLAMIDVGTTFFINIIGSDLRNPAMFAQRGVTAAYIDGYFKYIDNGLLSPTPLKASDFLDIVDVTFGASYPGVQSEFIDNPIPGSINETGASAFTVSGGTAPPTPALVFRIEVRATNRLPDQTDRITFVPDHADPGPSGDQTSVVIADGNFTRNLLDREVFLQESQPFRIKNVGEAEFTNVRQPLDVNADNSVDPVDALIVINDLQAHGSRNLAQGIAAGALPLQHYLDVDSDAFISPLDALVVFNYLNVRSIKFGIHGEGEASPAAPAATSALPLLLDAPAATAPAAAADEPQPLPAEAFAGPRLSDDVFARSLDALFAGPESLDAGHSDDDAGDSLADYLATGEFFGPLS